jgi:hypothetical protein
LEPDVAARAALQTLLEEDPALLALGVGAVYPTNSVDTPQEDLFLIVRWDPTTAAFGKTGTTRFTIWAHDRQKDYGRINDVLDRLADLVPDQVHLSGADGWILTCATWIGEGPDLYDGGYETLTRYADFQGVSRYGGSGSPDTILDGGSL